jgi:hypothetical protein
MGYMSNRVANIVAFACALFLYSCKSSPSNNTHGPIVLGDSSTIVTETDPQKLQDLVTDLKPDIPSAEVKDTDATENKQTAQAAVTDTARKTKITPPPPPSSNQLMGAGTLAEFKDVSVLIANVKAKLAGNPNLQHANGAVYTLTGGVLNGALIRVTGNVTKVSQRYQSVVLLKNSLGTLQLDAFTTTTDWQPLKGSNNQYRITGLDQRSLDFPEASNNAIRNAVMKAAKRRRMSRRKIEEMVASVHHAHAVNQKPLSVNLRSVMWKIDGKDASGKSFSKQIRVDIPL